MRVVAEAGAKVADRFLEELGASDAAGVEAASVEAILDAQQAVCAALEGAAGGQTALGVAVPAFYPVVGDHALARSPYEAIAAGTGADVAVLAGSNRDETTLWGYGDVDDVKLERMAERLGAASVLAAYRGERPGASPSDLMIALTTDHMFRIPAIRLVEAREARRVREGGAASWMYRFDWPSRAFGGRLKATHALEIPFAFDNLDRAGVDFFLGKGPSPQALAAAMHLAWTGFVRDGHPGWAPYELDSRTTMLFAEPSTEADDPDGAERAAWAGVR